MQSKINELKYFMDRLGYVPVARTCLLGLEERMERDPSYGNVFEAVVNEYMAAPGKMDDCLGKVCALGAEHGENSYTIQLLFVIHCFFILHRKYREAGISDDIYWRAADDTRCKLNECLACKNIPGTFVAGWNSDWFTMKRFALGRFQYEHLCIYKDPDVTLPCGYTVHYDDVLLGFHIPGNGIPLTDDVRNESYRMAWEFYKHEFRDEVVVLRTSSWLLYRRQLEFLPAESNLRKFMADFALDNWADKKPWGDCWRLFNQYAELPVEEWPEDTGLRRAYKKWFLQGNTGGWGAGLIILHNGVNVTHKVGYFNAQ